jgi:hypothetical protein
VTPTWLLPTARATSWQPMAGVAVAMTGVSVLAGGTGRWPASLLGIVAASLAAAVVAGLRDPAAALLAAVPTSAAVRQARRVALLAPVALLAWLAYLSAGPELLAAHGWPIGMLAALTGTGLAVAGWAPAGAAVSAGVAVPLLWLAAGRASHGLDASVAEVLLAWQHHPWIVTAAAVAALLMRRNR